VQPYHRYRLVGLWATPFYISRGSFLSAEQDNRPTQSRATSPALLATTRHSAAF